MKIVFMGTPDFAVPSLKILLDHDFDIVGVVTAPDKPAGRGRQLSQSPIKKYAEEHGLKVLQPLKLKDEGFLHQLKSLGADLQVVVAFRMLPEAVWNMPPLGTINLHASLLPDYRGAAPINWAIMRGEKETGVTTFFIKHEIDTGNVLFSHRVAIGDDEIAGQLHDRLMHTGAGLVLKTVKAIQTGEYEETPQPAVSDHEIQSAPKLFKEDCELIWNSRTSTVYNRIRGLSPHPAAFTYLHGKLFKIYAAEKEDAIPHAGAGTYLTDHKTYLKFACRDGYIHAIDVQYEGKKRMPVAEFLRGVRLTD